MSVEATLGSNSERKYRHYACLKHASGPKILVQTSLSQCFACKKKAYYSISLTEWQLFEALTKKEMSIEAK